MTRPKMERYETNCLHCIIREILISDVQGNDDSSPGLQGAAMGQAIGDIIGLKHPEDGTRAMLPDERYTACVNAVAMFAVALCKVAALGEHPVEQILFDAKVLAPKIKTV